MRWGRQPAAGAVPGAELAAAQERSAWLEQVLCGLDAAVLVLDAAGHRRLANPEAERLLPSVARVPQLAQLVEAVAASAEAWNGRVALADGRTLEVHIAPLAGDTVVVARDASATVRLEIARRDFIAAISHELRTPLTSIQGYAELLDEEASPETRRQYARVIGDSAGRLARLAGDLATLSSIETHTYPFRFEVLEAAALVSPALEVLAPLARQLGADLAAGARAPGRIRGDRDALHRALLNLAENALRHGGPGVRVEIAGAAAPASGEYLLSVRDNGVGIPWQDQPRVFERFYRVPGTAASTGLGLALVKHIILEHGGRIELDSALGRGSTFTARLPLL